MRSIGPREVALLSEVSGCIPLYWQTTICSLLSPSIFHLMHLSNIFGISSWNLADPMAIMSYKIGQATCLQAGRRS